jgi:hypothetical protein
MWKNNRLLASFFKKLNQRERGLAIAAGVVALLLTVERTGLEPLFHVLKRTSEQKKQLELTLRQSLRTLSQKEQVLRELELYESYFAKTSAGTEKEKQTKVAGLLLEFEVEEMARRHGVAVAGLMPKEVQETGLAEEYRVEIHTESTQKGLLQFLYALQSTKGLLYPEKLRITAAKAKKANLLNAQMSIVKTVVFSTPHSPPVVQNAPDD